MVIQKAADVIGKHECAVVVFTKGDHFKYDGIGNGETGHWVVNLEVLENVDKVVVYLRANNSGVNRIFLSVYSGVRNSPLEHRHIIRFSKLAEVGTTTSNWNEFANSGQNPVSYVGEFY